MVTRSELSLKDMWLFLVAIMLVMLVVGQGGTPAHSSRGEQVDDGALGARVKTELVRKVGVGSVGIAVETLGGHVELSGRVRREADRLKAEEAARSVAGVTSVSNKLTVR